MAFPDITPGDVEINIDGNIKLCPVVQIYNNGTVTDTVVQDIQSLPTQVVVGDHLFGFDKHFRNPVFDKLDSYAKQNNFQFTVFGDQFYSKKILDNYPNLNIQFNQHCWNQHHIFLRMPGELEYGAHPEVKFSNFVCSFNGMPHVSRKLLTAIIYRFGWFKSDYVSKNFSFTVENLDGQIRDFVGDQDSFYRKFFISEQSQTFFNNTNNFGHDVFESRMVHKTNIHNLDWRIANSFIHLVSETMATSYWPFVTEKFLYSVITRGLFLTYGQPGWHQSIEKIYGFKLYKKIFDYDFDQILNPVHRLVNLVTMISKFEKLDTSDWHDIYQIESDTIEYNYHHFHSGNYKKHVENYANTSY